MPAERPGVASPALPVVVRALVDAALALVRQSSSGPVALARLRGVVDLEAIPPRWRSRVGRELETAVEATGEPLAFGRVERELHSAWGERPDRVLDALEPEPLAVTATAQVHRGELDGRAVAVKVRRPGLDGAVRSDLGLMDALGPPLGRVFGSLDVGALLREARERVLDDLDLEHAGATQQRLARASRRLDAVTVPAVVSDLSAPGVLVCDLLDGPTLASRPPDDPGAVARALIAFTLGAPRAVALAPADPRAENVVLLGDGIGLLGVGAARAVDRARAERGLEALGALRASDRTGFVAAVQGLALLPAEAAGDAYDLLDELIGDILRGPVRFDAVAVSDLIDRALAAVARALPLTERLTAEPADLWPLRMLVQLAALLGRLGATEDFCALALAAGRDGWA